MWYSSRSRNEKADRPSKVESTASYPVEPGERIDGVHVRNISQKRKNSLLNNKGITYSLLFVLLLVTAGVTARQILVKSGSDKNETFRMKKLNDTNNISNTINALTVIAQDTPKNENLARYSISLVLLHVEEWKNFWSSKNIRGFMSFYHKNFPDKKNFDLFAGSAEKKFDLLPDSHTRAFCAESAEIIFPQTQSRNGDRCFM